VNFSFWGGSDLFRTYCGPIKRCFLLNIGAVLTVNDVDTRNSSHLQSAHYFYIGMPPWTVAVVSVDIVDGLAR